jgi:hypothetical protein
MNLIRKAHRNSLLLWLLAITVGLRALIAPGFMLETNGDGPFGLAIVLCEGLNGAIPSGTSEDPHALHGKHHGNTGTEEDAATGLTNATCGLWSTSSTFVEAMAFSADHLYPVGPDQFVIVSNSVISTLFRQQPQQPRAPPVTIII